MRILHIAHYNRFPRTSETFFGQNKNGLERFLETLIRNDNQNEHYIWYFNHYDHSIEVQGIRPNGEVFFYVQYLNVMFQNENILRETLRQFLSTFPVDVVHIHYLKPYVRILPKLLREQGIDQIMTTVHDESYLGVEFGADQAYKYDRGVREFFANNAKVVFLHEASQQKYVNYYETELADKMLRIPLGIPRLDRQKRLPIRQGQPFRVLILGTLNGAKGLYMIQELEKIIPSKIELHLLGVAESPLSHVIVHGAYTASELPKRVEEIQPDVVLIPSIVEEVFSYTALEATQLGYPVVAFSVGSFAYLEKEHRGFIIPEKTAESACNTLISLAEKKQDTACWNQIYSDVQLYPISDGLMMSEAYQHVYEQFTHVNEKPIDYTKVAQQNLNAFKQKEQQFYDQSVQLIQCGEANLVKKDERGKSMITKVKRAIHNRGGVKNTLQSVVRFVQSNGIKGSYYRATDIDKFNLFTYHRWLKKNEKTYSAQEVELQLQAMELKPTFSFLIPVYNVDEVYLRTCIDSIINQQYPHWELCLADDASTQAHIRPVLEQYMAQDERIKVVFREQNGHISAATNSALEIATGDFIALVDNDDFIRPNALLEIAKMINAHPDAEMIYTDEDKTDASGKIRLSPYFKPDWSPDAFWGHMYLCHLGVYKTEIARLIGGFRVGYEGAQDYDFALRFSEQTSHIYHVPQILYHWRMIPTSTAASGDNKSYAYDASIRAKESAIERRGYNGIVEVEERQLSTNVYFRPDVEDFISIIIPTKNHGTDVERLIHSIYEKSTWKQFEIILVDNNSDEAESIACFEKLQAQYETLKVVAMPVPFNYSYLNNEAVKYAKGNLLLFLNNDMEVMTPDWLERLAGQAKLPYAGAVGAKLYYPNDRVQHAGVLALKGSPVHAFHNFHRGELGYFGRLSLTYNYLAVTGACLMIEKQKFNEVGGFDEAQLPISYQDVDLCLKLYDKGYFNAVRADVELYHFESQTRGYDDTAEKVARLEREKAYLNERWHDYLHRDPFYNENLTQEKVDFTIG